MFDLFVRAWPLLVAGTLVTVGLGVASYLLALPVGLALAIGRLYGGRLLALPARTLVSFLCGTPLLVQVLLLYYGLPQIGVVLPAIPTVIVAFALHSGAFIGEDLRGAIGSVERGQWDAGASLGLAPIHALFLVVLPQALRASIPTLGTRFIGTMKETSLASVVTVVELTRVGEKVGSSSFRYLEIFVMVAAIYWALSFLIARLQIWFEQRFKAQEEAEKYRHADRGGAGRLAGDERFAKSWRSALRRRRVGCSGSTGKRQLSSPVSTVLQ